MKVYREWRISGDTEWLRRLWPKVRRSLDYCIETWDPGHKGIVEEPHHNTYDIEFWGPDGMCTSFYLGALDGRGRDGQGARRGRRHRTRSSARQGHAPLPRRSCSTASTSSRRSEWEGLRAKSPLETKSFGRRLLAGGRRAAEEGRAEVPVRARVPVGRRARARGWRRCLRRRRGARRGEGDEPPASRPPLQPEAGPVRARQPAAADVRLRRRGRPAAVHVAQGRQALAAVRLQRRGVDGHRVPGRLAPDADGPGRRGARGRPRVPRPLRRPRAQPVQRVRVRPLVRPGDVVATRCCRG